MMTLNGPTYGCMIAMLAVTASIPNRARNK